MEDQRIISVLKEQYDLKVNEIKFLPAGLDRNAASYQAITYDSRRYFIKLRRNPCSEPSILLPKFLSNQGIDIAIPPLETKAGHLWSCLDLFKLIVYPFVEGLNGYEIKLSERQWNDLGKALKMLHTIELPQFLLDNIRKETFSFPWGKALRASLARAHGSHLGDSTSEKLARFLRAKNKEILNLIVRAETLVKMLQNRSAPMVLCHSDLHAGNILIDPDGLLHIVDWDDPIIAPKERDLMFIGCGYWGEGQTPQEEEELFYRGYGQTLIDPIWIAFYRYARIVEDVVLFSTQVFEGTECQADREQSLHYLMSNFFPDNTIERAYALDRTYLWDEW